MTVQDLNRSAATDLPRRRLHAMNRTAVARQPRITRTESIAADLLREIQSGTWAVGDELPTHHPGAGSSALPAVQLSGTSVIFIQLVEVLGLKGLRIEQEIFA